MSVLEAWSYELPVVMTDYCNIPEGFVHNCAVRIEPTSDDISEKLAFLFQLPNITLAKMGQRGKELVASSFTWDIVAQQTLELYQYLLNKSSKPFFVYED